MDTWREVIQTLLGPDSDERGLGYDSTGKVADE